MSDDEVTVSVEGHLDPETADLPTAISTLWAALRALPLGALQANYFERLLGGDAGRVERMLDRDGQVELTIRLPEDTFAAVRIWRGEWTSAAQRAARRYLVVRHPDREGCFAIRDLTEGELVRDVEGTVLAYGLRRDADAWVRSSMYLAPGASRGQG
jgi:hypothetical protein